MRYETSSMYKRKSLISNILLIVILQAYSLQGITYAEEYDTQSQPTIEDSSTQTIDSVSSDSQILSDDVVADIGTGSTGDSSEFTGIVESGIDTAPSVYEPVRTISPADSIAIDENGKVDIKSLKSAYTEGGENGVTYCSIIAQANIENILRAGVWTDVDSIDRGDAADLISKGQLNGSLHKVVASDLSETLKSSTETVYEIYIEDTFEGINNSHRAVAVLGEDSVWHILDPLRGSKTIEPQVLSEYITPYIGKDDFQLFLGKGYNPMIAEKTINVPHDTITQAGEVTLEVHAGDIKIQDIGGDSNFDTVQDVVIEKISDDTFAIGDPKSHLEFSKPAKIEINVSDMSDGSPIDVTVQHEGDESYSSRGITLNEDATCNAGISSDENNIATVQNGKITFYTCGASTFNIAPSAGTATITTITSGTVLNTQLPVIGGTGSVNGSTVTLSLSGGSALGTGVVVAGQWFIQPTTSLGLGNHTLCVGSNCINITIIQFTPKGGDTDTDFTGSFANAAVNAILYQPDGNIILGGAFTTFNGITISRVVRVSNTGAIDPNFTGVSSNTIQTIYRQADGKILIGGGFVTYNGVSKNRIVRVTTTGVVDTTFAGTFGGNNFVYQIIQQPDGKLLVGGSFTTFNGGTVGRLVRLTATGATDNSFTGTFATNGTIFSLVQQTDGKILVGGSFTTFNGVASNGLIRVTDTGAIDPTFVGTFLTTGAVNSIIQQPDGKLLIGGSFTGFNGVASNSLVRITTGGSIDSSFSGSFTTGAVNTLLLQPDGKILVGGAFSTFNGVTANRLVRITSTGAVDTTYMGTFANGAVAALGMQLDGKVLAGGSFTAFNGMSGNRLVRLGVNNYTLTYTGSTGGIVSGNTNQTVVFNDVGTLVSAIANSGYTFTGWSDGYTGISRTDTVVSNTGFIAYFTINTYTLTYTGSTGGSVTGNLVQSLDYGTTGTTVIAVPDTEYTFSGWSDGYTGMSRTDVSLGNSNLVAYFKINAYTLTYTGTVGGIISGVASQTVNYGTTGSSVTAIANTGYTFSGWSDGSLPAMRSDYVTGNNTLTAQFTINTYTLQYNTTTGGTISGVTTQLVDYGTTGSSVTAMANTGYVFSGWSDGNVTTTRTDYITGNKTLTAQFTLLTYTLTYTGSTGGTISGATTQNVPYNSTGTSVTAMPNTGYTFSSWSDGGVVATRTDYVTGNKTLTAFYLVNTYILTYTGSVGGTISGTAIQGVNYGSTGSTVTAIANTGYTFSGWSDGSVTASRSDYITGNKTLIAQFTAISYTLTYTGSTGGTISGVTPQTVSYNSTGSSVTATANVGYTFTGWSDGIAIATRSDFVTGNKTLIAYFTVSIYTLTYTGTAGGIVSGTLVQTLNHNNTGTAVEAIANTGYTFNGWSDGYIGTGRIDVATGNRVYTALFVSDVIVATGQIFGSAGGGGGGWSPIIPSNPDNNNQSPTIITVPQFDNPTIVSIQNTVGDVVAPIVVGEVNKVMTNINPALQTNDTCYTPQDSVDIVLGANTKNKDQVVFQGLLRAYGLTRYSQTDIYMPEKGLTREEAAKMLVNFARNVLCRTAQFTYNNQYTDLDQADPTLKDYIILAYEYGLMKGGNGVFRPHDYISKDEFIASLMRTLLGKYLVERGDSWYESYKDLFIKNGYEALLKLGTSGNSIDRYTISRLMYTLYYNPSYQRTDIGYTVNR